MSCARPSLQRLLSTRTGPAVFVLESLTASTSPLPPPPPRPLGFACRGPRQGAGGPPPEKHVLGGTPAYCVHPAQPRHGGRTIVRAEARDLRSSVSLPIGAPDRCQQHDWLSRRAVALVWDGLVPAGRI